MSVLVRNNLILIFIQFQAEIEGYYYYIINYNQLLTIFIFYIISKLLISILKEEKLIEKSFMSQFIEGTKHLQNSPMFSLPTKQIVMPKIKKYIKLQPDQKPSDRKESIILSKICERLQKQQFQEIHNQNAMQMQKKFHKLKAKMYHNMQKQSVENVLNNTLNTDKLNIRQIVRMKPQAIQLDRKYGNRILLKMQNYRQAQQISQMKQNYRNWMNIQKNNRCNSPIFKKMAYLLERAHKQNILEQLPVYRTRQLSELRHTTKSQNNFNIKSIERKERSTVTNELRNKNVNPFSPYKRKQLNWGRNKQKFSFFRSKFDSIQEKGSLR